MAEVPVEVEVPSSALPKTDAAFPPPLVAPLLRPGALVQQGQSLVLQQKAAQEAAEADVSRGAATAGANAAMGANTVGVPVNASVAAGMRTAAAVQTSASIGKAAQGVAASGPAAPAAAALAVGGAVAVIAALAALGVDPEDVWAAMGDVLRSPAALLEAAGSGIFAQVDLSVPGGTTGRDAEDFGMRLGEELRRGA